MGKSWNSNDYKFSVLHDEAAISITSTATKYTLDSNYGFLSFQNVGTTEVWIGGPNVSADNSRGHKLNPGDSISFGNVLEGVVCHLVTKTGETGTISIIKG